MKNLVIFAVIAWACISAAQKLRDRAGPEPLFDAPYVLVYGRETCGLTQAMREELTRSHVPFEFQSIDDPKTADQVHARMERSGLSTDSYTLPVVDVSGRMLVSPEPQDVASAYRGSERKLVARSR